MRQCCKRSGHRLKMTCDVHVKPQTQTPKSKSQTPTHSQAAAAATPCVIRFARPLCIALRTYTSAPSHTYILPLLRVTRIIFRFYHPPSAAAARLLHIYFHFFHFFHFFTHSAAAARLLACFHRQGGRTILVVWLGAGAWSWSWVWVRYLSFFSVFVFLWFAACGSQFLFNSPPQQVSSTKIQSVFRAHVVRLRVRALGMSSGGNGGALSAAAIEERWMRAQKRLLARKEANARVL